MKHLTPPGASARARTWRPKKTVAVLAAVSVGVYASELRSAWDPGLGLGFLVSFLVLVGALSQAAVLAGRTLERRVFGITVGRVDITDAVVSARRSDFAFYWPTSLHVESNGHSLDFQKWFWRGWDELLSEVERCAQSA